jgi:cellulose synthase/poly-beta-1,6-N-acetylglucosamine synthase-like glycosyltransferase
MDYDLLLQHDDIESPETWKSRQGVSLASHVRGARPDAVSLAQFLKPLPETSQVIAALIPAYNEEASEILTTLTDIWLQEKNLSENRKLHVSVVLDGLDRGQGRPIMSQSTKALLSVCYPDCEEHWRAFEGDFDMSNNLILQRVDANGALCCVEFSEGMSIYLTVLIKRGNRLKYNSHEWFLKGIAYHYRKQVPYVFLTDAGTGFDRNCLSHLVNHLACSSPDVVACTGRQRVKTAAMQSHGRICTEPFLGSAWWLRALQAYEYEAGVSTFNGVFSLLGYLPVLPGPCALLKYHTCLEDGGIDEYLELVNSPPPDNASDVELWHRGNENLAEDRILSFTIVFPSQLKAVRRTEWVPLAAFFYDAELQLSTLCPQRRRWINGTYAAYLTVANRLDELVHRAADPAPTSRPRLSTITIDTATSGPTEEHLATGMKGCWQRERKRWAGGRKVLRLRALFILVRLQLAMHYITCLAPSLFALAVRLSLLTLISSSSAPSTLIEEDRETRARIICLFSDLAIYLGVSSWLKIHGTSKRVDTRIMVFYCLVVTCCYGVLLSGLFQFTVTADFTCTRDVNVTTTDPPCDMTPLFPITLAAIQVRHAAGREKG